MRNKLLSVAIASALVFSSHVTANMSLAPTKLQGLNYNKSLVTGALDVNIPSPESILGFPVGQRAATPEQITEALKVWQKASDKIQLVEYARSHEGRPLHYLVISSPENLAQVDSIKADLGKLANPVSLSKREEQRIIESLPAVAWMAYSIHGNEGSGSDAALATIYKLIASQDQDIQSLLSNTVVIVDPLMNPDGRARFTKELQQRRGASPNVDTQSTLHTDAWATGRSNHYFFDLNRDFILGVHPETRGIVQSINEWNPQLMIDAHEMGPMDSYLFGLARQPVNKNLSESSEKWGEIFEADQAQAFDEQKWPYYTGEWLENLYPGYSSYAAFRGTIHILYEQARIKEDGVMQHNGRIVSYAESVDKQFISSIENLKTLAKHSKAIYRDFVKDKRKLISEHSPYANQSFAILPTKNQQRLSKFIDLMQLQGFEILQTTKSMKVKKAKTQLGEVMTYELPVGTLIINNRQPQGRLIASMLEFDAKISNDVLIEERQRVLRDGSSLMYDATAWNITMLHGLEALTLPLNITQGTRLFEKADEKSFISKKENAIAYAVDGADDASVGFAARLMERGLTTRVIDKSTVLDGVTLSRGSIIVSRYDNEFFDGDLDHIVEKTATEVKVTAQAIRSGLGNRDLPDIGGSHFRVLTQPRIAILSGNGVNSLDFGTIWHSIDSNLGIRHSHLDSARLSFTDLRRYNTLVIPAARYSLLDKGELAAIKTWVEAGGTLVAIDGSALPFTGKDVGLSRVRQIQDTLKDAEQYDISLQREWLAQQNNYAEIKNIWSHDAASDINYPWHIGAKSKSEKELKKQYNWLAKFRPSGAIVAARTDQKHWLTFGSPEVIPVLISRNPVLMAKEGVRSAVRLGAYQAMSKSEWSKVVKKAKDKSLDRKVGWSSLPDKQELKLRMSGLLWPEASKRIANSAYLTQERKGNGQIILFAGQPVFRGSTLATNRLLLNALVYGPGLGARQAVTNL